MPVQNIQLSRMEGGLSAPMAHGIEAASETFIQGAPLIKDGSGNLAEAGAEPADEIVGIAAGPASGVTGADVPYYPISDNTVFQGNVGTSLTAGASAQAQQFEEYPLGLSGTSWFVDITDQTAPSVQIVGFIDPIGTVNGRVEFKFIHTALRANDA